VYISVLVLVADGAVHALLGVRALGWYLLLPIWAIALVAMVTVRFEVAPTQSAGFAQQERKT